MSSIARRAVFALIGLTLMLVVPASAVAAPPAGWGWVTARNPTQGSYTPAAGDQGNSSGRSNTVKRSSVGHYTIHFPGVNTSDGGGHVQVSALSSIGRYCTVAGWGKGAMDTEVVVRINCYRLNGSLADSAFSVIFLTRGHESGQIAYVWADLPTAADYTPEPFYESPSGTITVHRLAAGRYQVRLPGFDAGHGNVQVSGYGTTPCKIGETSSDGSAMLIGVVCPSGDTQLDLLYTRAVGLTGVVRPKAAYLRAFPLRSAANRFPTEFRYSSAGNAPTLTRSGVGTYVVTLPGMPRGGAAHVTAGPGAETCYLTSIRTGATPQRIGVTCRNLSGSLADAAFDLSYTK